MDRTDREQVPLVLPQDAVHLTRRGGPCLISHRSNARVRWRPEPRFGVTDASQRAR
jgi:hypothetical protein